MTKAKAGLLERSGSGSISNGFMPFLHVLRPKQAISAGKVVRKRNNATVCYAAGMISQSLQK